MSKAAAAFRTNVVRTQAAAGDGGEKTRAQAEQNRQDGRAREVKGLGIPILCQDAVRSSLEVAPRECANCAGGAFSGAQTSVLRPTSFCHGVLFLIPTNDYD